MKARICDVCDKHHVMFSHLRRRWRFFKVDSNIEGDFKRNVDICDNCLTEFLEWIRFKLRNGAMNESNRNKSVS